MTFEERIGNKVIVVASGCWLWTGSRDRKGYGRLGIRQLGAIVGWKAHRYVYTRLRGRIPNGCDLHHDPLCGNKSCVHPFHTEPIGHKTHQDLHCDDRRRQRKECCLRGHSLSGDNLRVRSSGDRACRACVAIHSRQYRKRASVLDAHSLLMKPASRREGAA